MKVTWLGQAGLLFDNGDIKVMIDPYLSNSVEKRNKLSYRRVPINESFLECDPDVMVFTHDHIDHYDQETAEVFLKEGRARKIVLAPSSVWQKARTLGGGHNYVEFNRHTEWTEKSIRMRAVKAVHSDNYAIGVLIEDLKSDEIYYVVGDSLYSSEIFADLPSGIKAVFLPVNGVGNNMNATDAARFASRVGAKISVPIHVGMFDELKPEIFTADNRLILELYKETEV